jgi:hypothetical protein
MTKDAVMAITADRATIKGSLADYWINTARTGVWRTARADRKCDHTNTVLPCPHGGIKKGERYLDTGERRLDRMWATYKDCEKCANLPCPTAEGEQS